MKKISTIILAFLALLVIVSSIPHKLPAQQSGGVYIGPARRFIKFNTLPATCTTGDVAYQISDSKFYQCATTNTWTAFGSGGGGAGTGNAGANVQVTNSATPTFTCPSATAGTIVNFAMASALATNITGSTLTGCTGSSSLSSILMFVFTQDGTGGRTVVWPAGFSEAPQISPIANATTNVSFLWDGTTANLIAANTTGNSVVTETAAPAGSPPSTYEFPWFDATGLFPRWKNSAGTIFQAAKELASGNIRKAGGANAVDSAAAAADIVALFSGCSGTLYLGADGACHTIGAGSSNCAPTTIGPGFCTVTISSVNILATPNTDVSIISAPGAGLVTYLTSIVAEWNFVTTNYAGAGTFSICYTNNCNTGVSAVSGSGQLAGVVTVMESGSASKIILNGNQLSAGFAPTPAQVVNKLISWENTGSAFTTGDGNVYLNINYVVMAGYN